MFPVGRCLAPLGATTRPAEACSGRDGEQTEAPEALWALDAATSVATVAACPRLWHIADLSQAWLSAGILPASRCDGRVATQNTETNIHIYIYLYTHVDETLIRT